MGYRTIIIAWSDMSGFRLTGRYLDRYGLEPEAKAVEIAKAVCWLREGTLADVRRAEEYRASDIAPSAVRSGVYEFDPAEPDPIGKAKAMLMGSAHQE